MSDSTTKKQTQKAKVIQFPSAMSQAEGKKRVRQVLIKLLADAQRMKDPVLIAGLSDGGEGGIAVSEGRHKDCPAVQSKMVKLIQSSLGASAVQELLPGFPSALSNAPKSILNNGDTRFSRPEKVCDPNFVRP